MFLDYVTLDLEQKMALVNEAWQVRAKEVAAGLPKYSVIMWDVPEVESLFLDDIKKFFNDDWSIKTKDASGKELKDPLRALAIELKEKIVDKYFEEVESKEAVEKEDKVHDEKLVKRKGTLTIGFLKEVSYGVYIDA